MNLSRFSPIPAKVTRANHTFWFCLSLVFALLYAVPVVQQAFAGAYIVQDDARQHVFWMRRFLDPALFPNDLIADYFQSVAPPGYTALYRFGAQLGLDPLQLSKLLPLAIAIISTLYGFKVALQLLPFPVTGFIASVFVNQVIWSHDDVASASPRAFLPAIFLAFLYYLLKRSLLPVLGAIVLQSLFYPQYVLIFAGIVFLQPLQLQADKLKFSRDRQDYALCVAGSITAVLVLLPYVLESSEFGAALTGTAAKALAEFHSGGRSQFFSNDAWKFWITGERSGIFPRFMPALLGVGFLLPFLLRSPRHFPLIKQINSRVDLLLKISGIALFCYFVAHVLLFRLHLPSRYTASSLRFLLVFATAIAFTLLLDATKRLLSHRQIAPKRQPKLYQKVLALGCIGGLSITFLCYPIYTHDFPKTNYLLGEAPQLYTFLQQQPKTTVVASLLREADFIPTFAQRSLFVGREYAIPYHTGYGDRFRQRVTDLIRAQYTRSDTELLQFIRANKISFWLVKRTDFRPAFLQQNWTKQYPAATQAAIASLQQGKPILQSLQNRCTVLQTGHLQLLDVQCIERSSDLHRRDAEDAEERQR